MTKAVKEAGVTNMVAFNYRRTPAVALAKRFIDEGRIGKILNFRGTYLQDWSADPNGPLSWRFQKNIAGSGAIGDIGTHVVDMAHYLVGNITEVNAITKTYIKERPIQAGGVDKLGASDKKTDAPLGIVDVDDEVLSLIRFETYHNKNRLSFYKILGEALQLNFMNICMHYNNNISFDECCTLIQCILNLRTGYCQHF